MIRSALRRPILVSSAILGIAAAGTAAAMHTTPWAPIDAFLDQRSAPTSEQALLANDTSSSAYRAPGRTPFGAYNPKAEGPAAFATGSPVTHDSAKPPSASGFAADRLHGANAARGNGPSASAGNLWRLMGLAHANAASSAAATHASTPRQAAAPKSPKTPSSHSGSGHAQAPTPVATLAQTTPAMLIGNDPAPVGSLIGGAAGSPIPPPGGGVKIAGGGGSLAATPEPAPALLFGTGLIGLAALVRRRRA